MGDQVVAPFRINASQHDLDDLRLRLHFAAHKVPELYVPDVRAFFRSIVR